MQPLTYTGNIQTNFIAHWSDITKVRKPIIAAVSGYAVSSLSLFSLPFPLY